MNSDNLFNGNSTSNMADSRFTLNTGEIFGAGGQVQTNTSVYDAIGEGLPTPPTETIQELQVTTSMYDASMGQKSGAHIELTTISGTNDYHGQVYEYFQNSALDAAPTFVVTESFLFGRAAPSSQCFRWHDRRTHQEGQTLLLRLLPAPAAKRRLERDVQRSTHSRRPH